MYSAFCALVMVSSVILRLGPTSCCDGFGRASITFCRLHKSVVRWCSAEHPGPRREWLSTARTLSSTRPEGRFRRAVRWQRSGRHIYAASSTLAARGPCPNEQTVDGGFSILTSLESRSADWNPRRDAARSPPDTLVHPFAQGNIL